MLRFLKGTAAKMSPRSTDTYDDDVRRAREDNDPQTIFYLKLASADHAFQQTLDASHRDLSPTLYYWATKIERTVREKLGSERDPKRGATQPSYGRASYRVEILNHLARDTPWYVTRVSQEAKSGMLSMAFGAPADV